MGNKSRFSIAKPDIIQYFKESGKKVFSRSDISSILSEKRTFWRLTESLRIEKFIELLLDGTDLKRHQLDFNSLVLVSYSWGHFDILDLALSLKRNGYMSHYTSLSYLGLTEQIPKTIYITDEQSEKVATSDELLQEQIDQALAKPARLSNNYAVFDDQTIFLLKGKHTNQLGVEVNVDTSFRATNIERTLIDIAVRPEYSGGIYEVMKAYENAHQDVSINKLISYLKKLDYTYPYHQCIGFYMMATGKYSESQLQLVRKLDMPLNFYLTHGIEDKRFSKEWNLFYPANLQF
jgi:hypothetical protein